MSAFEHIVVLIPGILGSELSKDGKVIWGGDVGAMWGATFAGGLSSLRLHEIGSLADDIGDGVEVTGLLRTRGIMPSLSKVDGYVDLEKTLLSTLNLIPGKNYHNFPYDWRRDNRVAATLLDRQSRRWLHEWRKESGNDNAQLVFVAHSMGGLIARYFIEVLEGWKITRALFAIATPFYGSGNALQFLHQGTGMEWLPASVKGGFDGFRSFDSVYQLLPTDDFVIGSDGSRRTILEKPVSGIEPARAIDAADFHGAMEKAASANRQDPAYLARKGPLRTVIGSRQPTICSADSDEAGNLTFNGKRPTSDWLWGDGIVPRASATPFDYGEEVATFVPTGHAYISAASNTTEHLAAAIAGLPDDRLRAGPVGSVGLLVQDAYDALEVVTIVAETGTSAQYLDLEIADLSGRHPLSHARMYPKNDRYDWAGSLPAGTYKARVSCADGFPAQDMFTVVDTHAGGIDD